MNPPIIYTTNYDDAIESAGNLLKRNYYKIVGLKDIVTMPHGARQIIKFHGDFSDIDSIIITSRDYESRLKIERNPLDVLFRAHILGKSVLFLGYSFSDKNIEYIFNLHTELYGADSLNKSYIISFNPDPAGEEALRVKNVITLVLESQEELNALLTQMGEKIAEKRVEQAFEDMNNSFVTTVITDFELRDLKKIFAENKLDCEQLSDKLRRAIEMKEIPDDVEEDLVAFIEVILNGGYDHYIKKQLAYAYHNIQFRKAESVMRIAFALLPLTRFEDCRISLKNPFDLDVLMLMSMKFGECFGADESRKIMAVVILSYLEGMKNEGTKLEFSQETDY